MTPSLSAELRAELGSTDRAVDERAERLIVSL